MDEEAKTKHRQNNLRKIFRGNNKDHKLMKIRGSSNKNHICVLQITNRAIIWPRKNTKVQVRTPRIEEPGELPSDTESDTTEAT